MARKGSMRGVHADNGTAEAATRRRRAALGEEAILGQAYGQDKRLCLHVPYGKFRNIVRDLARKNDVSLGAAAASWVARWSQQADRLAKNSARNPESKFRVLPDGKRVFYGS